MQDDVSMDIFDESFIMFWNITSFVVNEHFEPKVSVHSNH